MLAKFSGDGSSLSHTLLSRMVAVDLKFYRGSLSGLVAQLRQKEGSGAGFLFLALYSLPNTKVLPPLYMNSSLH